METPSEGVFFGRFNTILRKPLVFTCLHLELVIIFPFKHFEPNIMGHKVVFKERRFFHFFFLLAQHHT
ncbi:hypothetical protein LINGRAHAP2_LOCUS14752 [Linum grandiflorum]